MMKPLTASDIQISNDSLGELLDAFKVKDTAANRQMVQQMQQEGVPVSKENVKAFDQLMRSVPEGVNKEEWTQAAVLAFKKGLPLTLETVAALRQVTTGQAVGQVLEQLEQQVSTLLEQQPGHPATDTVKQVMALLKDLRASAAATWPTPPPEEPAAKIAAPAASQSGAMKPAAASTGSPPVTTGSAPAPAAAAPPAAQAPLAAGASLPSAALSAEEAPAAPAQPAAIPTARPEGAGGMPQAQARSAEPASKGEPPVAGSPAPVQPPAEQKAAGVALTQPRSAAPSEPAAAPDPNWISKMLKAVGVEHEAHLAKLDERTEALLRPQRNIGDQLPNLLGTTAQQDDSVKPVADTLKSLLLQLTASDDTPAPLKEAAQQAIGQITGQQLMLTGDKSSMFAHMTLFVPFLDGTGQQSAAIHIQSQKGRRGEVDASNCRLLFDLQMKVMGNTLVDVHVVNKIVSLNIHNDHPALAPLMEESKDEITAAMNKAGYQFISLKCSPYPELPVGKPSEAGKQGQSEGRADLRSLYQPKPYKGVDFRA
ncbi:hypothetical protein [Paenibacillus sp. N3.4]|uniref:hypothetical protein n=1 Tax=Paenibacillus sp. N3.4 TaxID=2603222 RepID=UPI0011CB8A6F|nr:hypothetical protein [Paenibacillus sp. N3.4]TXK77467.1 hypothetical protein FU659_22655 [Paenibacillus sp. N3.4]